MVNKIKNKNGFSLAEALISMLILSIFFLATSKVMTTKQKPDEQVNPHGFYECYVRNGNQLVQRRASESNVTAEQFVDSCTFTPSQGIAYVTIYAVRNSNDIIMAVEPQFNNPIDEISSVAALRNFGNQLDNAEENDLDIENLRNYLEISYPRSGLLGIINDGTYNNNDPALFIGW